jgi:hypothetical protein
MEIIGHGENSITYQLFNELGKHKLFLLLHNNTVWVHEFKMNEEDIEEVHLFPNFGKKFGYGEPDALILAAEKVIYVEVEMCNLNKGKLPEPFIKQMKKFKDLAKDIYKSDRKRLTKKFEGASGYKFQGPKRLRSLYSKITKKPRDPHLLVISDSSDKDIDVEYLDCLNKKVKKEGLDLGGLNLGWISLRKIKRMKGLSSTAKTINYNLEA